MLSLYVHHISVVNAFNDRHGKCLELLYCTIVVHVRSMDIAIVSSFFMERATLYFNEFVCADDYVKFHRDFSSISLYAS